MNMDDARNKLMSTLKISYANAIEQSRVILSVFDRMLKCEPGMGAPLGVI